MLYAAGEDFRLRGWSLRTAEPILAPTGMETTVEVDLGSSRQQDNGLANPFLAKFPRPLASLQVLEEPGEPGVCLWAGGEHLYQYHLGQRIPRAR